MNESTLVPREEMSDLDWLARNVHVWRSGYDLAVVQRGGGEIYVTWPSVCSCGITKKQWLARRAELQNKPSWKEAPEWAQWLGQDEDGVWYWHGEEPNSKGEDVNGCCYWMSRGLSDISCRGELLGDWRDTLEKRPDANEMPAHSNQPKPSTDIPECAELKQFEPFVSVEDAATAKQPAITPSKYTKTIHSVSVDVYDVLQAWGVSNPALQHLIKKALQCGQRGHKDNAQDLQDIIDSAIRAKELEL